MKCARALKRMRTVPPAALRGEGISALARHVRTCASCRAAADAVLAEAAALDRALDDYASAGDPVAAAHAALAAVARVTADPNTRRWVWAPVAGAALAAAVTAWVVLGPPSAAVRSGPATSVVREGGGDAGRREGPAAAVGAAVRASTGGVVSVAPPANRLAAVIRTENPKITIVWLMKRGGS